MNNTEFFAALDLLVAEKGISKKLLIEKIENALARGYRAEMQSKENAYGKNNADKKDKKDGKDNEFSAKINEETKEIKVYRKKAVVELVSNPQTEIALEDAKKISPLTEIGQTIDVEWDIDGFSRIGARQAKQIILQGINEAEKDLIAKEYENKLGEIITATVLKVDPQSGNASVDIKTSKPIMFLKSEQIPGEVYKVGQHIKVFIMEVNRPDANKNSSDTEKSAPKSPVVMLSRTHFGFVKRLFELEIPEIQNGTVVIKNISREAGSRTKIAVESRDENVDPVGACIGNRGVRIANILNELSGGRDDANVKTAGEKIDVIKYSESPEEYIAAALSPATVKSVTIDGEHSCRVIVDPTQLSLAIGKEGQNVRLAARLTGYKIDIKTM